MNYNINDFKLTLEYWKWAAETGKPKYEFPRFAKLALMCGRCAFCEHYYCDNCPFGSKFGICSPINKYSEHNRFVSLMKNKKYDEAKVIAKQFADWIEQFIKELEQEAINDN